MTPRPPIFLFRTLKRLALASLCILFSLLIIRLAWGALAASRLNSTRAQLFQQFTNTADPSLLESPILPDSENAALPLIQAVHSFNPDSFRSPQGPGPFTSSFGEFNWAPAERAQLHTIESANAESFRLLDLASTRPRALWPTSPDTPPDSRLPDNTPFAERLRTLIDFTAALAAVAHAEDRDDRAGAHLRRITHIDRILAAAPSVTAHSLGSVARTRVITFTERFAPSLLLDRPTGASSADLRDIAIRLADDRDYQLQLARACLQEASRTDFSLIPLDSSQPGGELYNWWLRPLLFDERRRQLTVDAQWFPILSSPNAEPLRTVPRKRPVDHSNLSYVVSAASDSVDAAWSRNILQHHRALTDGRAAAVLLAARLIQQTRGSFPTTAESFVPAIFPQPPVDPFAADGRPLRYRLDPTGPTVWSVGTNGLDEDALISLIGRGRGSDQPDLVYGAAWRASRSAFATTTPATRP